MNITIDKIKHIICAFIILTIVALALKGGAEWSNIACALVGALASETALFGKEYYDMVIKGTKFDCADIKWGQIGVIAAFLCAWLFM